MDRSIETAHDEAKDKDYELEMTWICAKTNWTHTAVPAERVALARQLAKRQEEEEEDEEMQE